MIDRKLACGGRNEKASFYLLWLCAHEIIWIFIHVFLLNIYFNLILYLGIENKFICLFY